MSGFQSFSLGENIIEMTDYLQITSYRLVNMSDNLLDAKSSNSSTDEDMNKTGKRIKTSLATDMKM